MHLNAEVLAPLTHLVVDLDTLLAIDKVYELSAKLARRTTFERKGGKVYIELSKSYAAGEIVSARIEYGGIPREARRAPWDAVFTWAKTASGQPWIATTCEGEGADLWWPCKDHPSDEPDSMKLHIRVPAGLVVASNGVLTSVDKTRRPDRDV